MSLVLMGDWYTVISVREYRDALLDQKPFDDDDAEYGCYRIPCKTMNEVWHAYTAFKSKGLHGEIQLDWATEDRGVIVHTRSGYAGDGKPAVDVTVNESTSPIEAAAKQAVEILLGALK